MESTAAENGDESGRTDSATPTESGTLTAIEPSPTPTPSNQADPETGQSQRQPIFSAIVHKGGTGAYASSEGARKEFPRLDLGVRGAISIARRLQDPLVELAKIQPKAIILGPNSQEVEQKRLKQKLHGILESCINHVGVDLNRAPVELLGYVAGLNARLARNIVEFRQRNGSFSSRSQLMEVPALRTPASSNPPVSCGSREAPSPWIERPFIPSVTAWWRKWLDRSRQRLAN